jgi:hypothetical protein
VELMNSKRLVECVWCPACQSTIRLSASQNSNELFSPHLVKHRATLYRLVTNQSEFHSLLTNTSNNLSTRLNTSGVYCQVNSSKHRFVKANMLDLFREQKVNTWSVGSKSCQGNAENFGKELGSTVMRKHFTGHNDFKFNRKKHRRFNMEQLYRPGVALKFCFSTRT